MSLCLYFMVITVVLSFILLLSLARYYLTQKRVREHRMLREEDDDNDEDNFRQRACNPSHSEFWIVQALVLWLLFLMGSIFECPHNNDNTIYPVQNITQAIDTFLNTTE